MKTPISIQWPYSVFFGWRPYHEDNETIDITYSPLCFFYERHRSFWYRKRFLLKHLAKHYLLLLAKESTTYRWPGINPSNYSQRNSLERIGETTLSKQEGDCSRDLQNPESISGWRKTWTRAEVSEHCEKITPLSIRTASKFQHWERNLCFKWRNRVLLECGYREVRREMISYFMRWE